MIDKKIYILTGKKQTGKTTCLQKWALLKTNVHGILTPVINGKRVFMNAHTGHTFEMEADIQNEEDFLPVGKFIFSKKGFAKAIAIIEKGILEEDGWLVIDEIGPLEINGLGFAEILEKKIPAVFKKINLLIVVRQSLTEEVINHFNLSDKEVTVVEIENSLFQKEF